jgi:hypothetical protein
MIRSVTKVFRTFAGWDECTRDGGIELSRGRAGVRLAPRVVLADEMGRTNPHATEPFGGRVVVKKQFIIDDPNVTGAVLAPYLLCDKPGAKLTVRVNGHPLSLRWKEKPDYWQVAWTPIRVPVEFLQQGLNEVVFSAREGAGWALIIEHTRFPRRSAKSIDNGQTWSFSGLGGTGAFLHGEYVVRLELKRRAPEGVITSPPVDLALLAGAGGIAANAAVRKVRVSAEADIPEGTAVALQARFGPSPSYDPATWSCWEQAAGEIVPPPGARFMQWQAALATSRPDATPLLKSIGVAAELDVQKSSLRAAVVGADNPKVVRSSYPFAHQRFEEPRLAKFREKWNLETIVSPVRSDFENLIALRNWTRHQWEDGWNRGPMEFCPPWDGFLILELASRQLSLGMCTHYSTALVHACAALGYTARTQIMHSHCVVEIWSNALRKWVFFDHSGDTNDARKMTFHFERNGVPQSALEIHRALLDGTWTELQFSPPAAAEAFKLQDRVKLYDRFCIHFRNDELSSMEPGEPEHGARCYHYDEYLWWTDRRTPPPPWFSRVSSREGDFHWTLNHAEIHLQHTGRRALDVRLDTETPNLDTLLCRIDGGDWQPCAASFRWPLHDGNNTLEVQPRNKFGHLGIVSKVVVSATAVLQRQQKMLQEVAG